MPSTPSNKIILFPAQPEHPRRIVSHTFGELLAHHWPTPEPIIGPWLHQGEAAMIWAATGVGKTMLSLTIALMAAGGGSVAGWSSPRPRKVLIIDGEMRGADLVSRMSFLANGIDGFDMEAAKANLTIRARQMQHPDAEFYDLAQPDTHERLRSYIMEEGFELVILDNITTLTDSLTEENDVGAVKPIINFVVNMKQANVASIIVHHSNKGGNNYRGSTGLVAPLDVVIGLTRPDGAEQGSAAFKLDFGKFRHHATGLGTQVFTLEESEFGPRWNVREDQDRLVVRLVAELRKCEHHTQEAAGRAVGITDKTKVSKLLGQAKGIGLIKAHEIKNCLAAARADEPDNEL